MEIDSDWLTRIYRSILAEQFCSKIEIRRLKQVVHSSCARNEVLGKRPPPLVQKFKRSVGGDNVPGFQTKALMVQPVGGDNY